MSGDERVWRPSEIIARYERDDRDFRNLEILDPEPFVSAGDRLVSAGEPKSFRDAQLDGADFGGSFIVADFTGAHLRDARFTKANVKTCAFDDAELSGADFRGAAIDGATFQGARFGGTRFEGATIQSVVLTAGERPL